MRFLAAQEDGYGVGLVQEQLPDYVDESVMAATGDTEPDDLPRVEEGSMISNLPLLFVDGYPTSLDKINLKQLERFIEFMVQCSLGHDTAQVISKPQWWPKEVKFTNPLIRPKKLNDSWMANLKKLVFRCYTYHRSEYLLRFCSYLAQYPRDKLHYVNNWDSTTSLYHKVTGKLLVTFRNENMNYDKIAESPRRCLLPQNGVSSGFTNRSKQSQQQSESNSLVVIQPSSEEIYLCDNCDAEVVGLEKMKEHERTCGNENQEVSVGRSQTPSELPCEAELAQNQFLQYFNLHSESQPCKRPVQAKPIPLDFETEGRTSRRVRGNVNLTRCPAIPFSSPAGLAMAKKYKMMTEGTQQERLDRIERHLYAPALGRSSRPKWLDRLVEYNRWVVSYKPNRDKPIVDELQSYTHEYKFNSRRNRLVLSIRSQLLYMSCKPIYVYVERLSAKRLEELKRDPSKYSTPIRRIATRRRPRPGPKSLPKFRRDGCISTPKRTFTISKDVTLSRTRDVVREAPLTESIVSDDSMSNSDDFMEITVIKQVPWKTEIPKDEPANSSILLVDLCSSDEENEIVPVTSDENRDPMRASVSTRTSFAKSLTLNKYRGKACIHPADSTSDWLRDSVLTDENDKSSGKCHGKPGNVLESCTHFAPIFKTSP